MIYFSFPLASCKWKACIAQGQTFSETAMVTNHLHGNSKSLQIVSDLWGLLGETELVRRAGGAMMDPVPLDDASGIGCESIDNRGPWMTMIRVSKSDRNMGRCFSFKSEWGYFILHTINLL